MNARGSMSLADRLTDEEDRDHRAVLAARINDPLRLAAVRRIIPLHRRPSLPFDRLTRLAAQLLSSPVALLTVVESDRQLFVSSYGLPDDLAGVRETPIEWSICQYVVALGAPLIVANMALEPALAAHPAVRALGAASYAGIPLVALDQTVGALAVVDFRPRDWTDDELSTLASLAGVCIEEMRSAQGGGRVAPGT